MDNNQFVASVLYNEAIKEEKKWRKNKQNKHDIELADRMLNEINKLGYDFKLAAELIHREIFDLDILKIIQRYIGCFSDEGISAELIGIIGIKNNIDATETIINNYENSSTENKHKQAGFYDNALYNIKDKRYIEKYLEFIQNEEDVLRLPLTMTLIAQWNISEAKIYFLRYLNSQNRNLGFVAIECLSYYKNDNSVLEALNNSMEILRKDKDINKAIKRAIKKLTKDVH